MTRLTRSAARVSLIVLFVAGMLTAGCGQKGDLYLPGRDGSPERANHPS